MHTTSASGKANLIHLVTSQSQVNEQFRNAMQLPFSRGDFQQLLRRDGPLPVGHGYSDAISDYYRGGKEAQR